MKAKLKKIKDDLYYYFAVKNWGVNREYGPYKDSHMEEHHKKPWKHWWMLIRLNWHYRIKRRTDILYYAAPKQDKRRLPYLGGAESSLSKRKKEIYLARELAQYDVISFDIFDTLILRPFANPADLFMLVGKRLNRMEFHRIRTDAEKRARDAVQVQHGHREVTIYDIYDVIAERTGMDRDLGVQTEFQTELDYCYANPYMQRVFRLLQEQGKTIIITSDMYLPHEMMEKLLKKCGYEGYAKLYVSCDYDCSKRAGSLYQYVKRDFAGKRIIHVGDNYESDIKSARASHLSTNFYRNVNVQGKPYRAEGMSDLVGSAYAGIVNAHLHNGIRVYSPYYEYGYIYGGLYIFGFCNWMHKKAKKEGIDKIFFLSRDGAIYQKAFNLIFDDVENEYFLWSRIANIKYTIRTNREDFLKRVVLYRTLPSTASSIRTLLQPLNLSHFEKYLSDYGMDEQTLVTREKVPTIERLFIDHWDEVCQTFDTERNYLRDYIAQKLGDAKRIAVVDVGWLGSGPMGLKKVIEEDLGFDCKVSCWIAGSKTTKPQDHLTELMDESIETYLFSPMQNHENHSEQSRTKSSLNKFFFELFTQAETSTYSGFTQECRMQFDIPEVENYHAISEIHKGILDFCKEYKAIFAYDPLMYNISGYDAYMPFRMIIRDLSFFKKHFSDFTAARTIGGDSENQEIETIGDILRTAGI